MTYNASRWNFSIVSLHPGKTPKTIRKRSHNINVTNYLTSSKFPQAALIQINYHFQARHLDRKMASLFQDHLQAPRHQYNTLPCNLLLSSKKKKTTNFSLLQKLGRPPRNQSKCKHRFHTTRSTASITNAISHWPWTWLSGSRSSSRTGV